MKKRFLQNLFGFTLIELFLVILLISIIIFLSIPRFRLTLSSLELRSFSNKVAHLMCYAQSRAIAEGKSIYFLKEKKNFILTDNQPEIKERKILENKFSLSIPEKIKVELEAKEFVFHPDGRITFIEPRNPHPKIILSNEVAKFQIISKGTIGKIIVELDEAK